MNAYIKLASEASEVLGRIAVHPVETNSLLGDELELFWSEGLALGHESCRAIRVMLSNGLVVQPAAIARQFMETSLWMRWCATSERNVERHINASRNRYLSELRRHVEMNPEDAKLREVYASLRKESQSISMEGYPRGEADLLAEITGDVSLGKRSYERTTVILNVAAHGNIPELLQLGRETLLKPTAAAVAWGTVALVETIHMVIAQSELPSPAIPTVGDTSEAFKELLANCLP